MAGSMHSLKLISHNCASWICKIKEFYTQLLTMIHSAQAWTIRNVAGG